MIWVAILHVTMLGILNSAKVVCIPVRDLNLYNIGTKQCPGCKAKLISHIA